MKRQTRFALVFLMAVSACFTAAHAQAGAGDKKQLVVKLLDISGGEKIYQQTIGMIQEQTRQMVFANIQQQLAAEKDLTPEQQQKALGLLQQAATKMMERLNAYLTQDMPFSKMIDEIYFPVYDKYFSAGEISEIIGFYEKPTGKKVVQMMPTVMQEVMTKFGTLYQPKIEAQMNTISKEEMDKVMPELDKIKKK